MALFDRTELGVAVVGAGRIGTHRSRLAAQHPAVRFLAISDAEPERARWMGKVGYLLLAAGGYPGGGNRMAKQLEFLQSLGIPVGPRGGTPNEES